MSWHSMLPVHMHVLAPQLYLSAPSATATVAVSIASANISSYMPSLPVRLMFAYLLDASATFVRVVVAVQSRNPLAGRSR